MKIPIQFQILFQESNSLHQPVQDLREMAIVNLHLSLQEMEDFSFHGIYMLLNLKTLSRYNLKVKVQIQNHQMKKLNQINRSYKELKAQLKSMINNKNKTLIRKAQMKKSIEQK
jgi:predicted TIM-barrel fold metal-dependent hydrolase